MLSAANLARALVSLVSFVIQFIHDRDMMEAGAAKAVLQSLKDADDAIAKANDARANADKLPNESDPNNRNR